MPFLLKRILINSKVEFITILILSLLFQSAKRSENFFLFKDRSMSYACSSDLHKFTCISCKATHYRKTPHHFIARCREHPGVNKKGESIKGVCLSVRDRIDNTDHSTLIDGYCIIDNVDNEFDLLIHESFLTLNIRPTLYYENSSIPLCLSIPLRLLALMFTVRFMTS